MRTFSGKGAFVSAVLVAVLGLAACNKADEGLTRQVLEANDKVLACQKDLSAAKNEIASLKRQLAQAIANPSHVQLTDPETIQLVASLRSAPAAGGGDEVGSGGLDPKKASEVVMHGAQGMQACYERALKNSVALQRQAGLGLVLGITVRPTGDVRDVDISPNVDKDMIACMRNVATRWKFPSFAGSAVTIEQKLTLTPKT
jgi:hypothetical protein